jgi:hypothetical protein
MFFVSFKLPKKSIYFVTKQIIMKKTTLTIVMACIAIFIVQAQSTQKNIGLRFGPTAEISYQHPLSDVNRVEIDLGTSRTVFSLNGIYHWTNDLSDWADGLSWYYGPGATLGFVRYNNIQDVSRLALGVVGQIGLEYNFNFPLQLTADFRPAIYIYRPKSMDYSNYGNFCISARYRF